MKRGVVFIVVALFLMFSVLAQESGGCQNKKFGLVGASNTVAEDSQGNKVNNPMSKIIEEICPGSQVFLYAVGGWGPRAQKSLVDSLLAAHADLDYVILDVSVNQMRESPLEVYTADAIELARMVKEKNSNTKVIMLTPTPYKGPNYWSQAVQDKQDAFNANLLSTKLGVPELIDYAVDVYSATEDPPGSDSCGKYCKEDNLHFFDGTGRRAVITAMLNTVFGTGTTTSSVPIVVPVGVAVPGQQATLSGERCNKPQRCREIDEIWQKLTNWLAKARKGQVWDTTRGAWVSFAEKYLKVVELKPPVPVPVPVAPPVKPGICAANYGTPEQRALLDTIAWAEGATNKYNIMFGGSEFTNYAAHPLETGEMPPGRIKAGEISSTAAGRYQFIYSTYKSRKEAGFFQTGFYPAEQDKAALSLASQRGVTEEILQTAANSGEFTPVWDKLAREWASLPYSKECPQDIIEKYSQYSWFDPTKCGNGRSIYSQGGRSHQALKDTFNSCLQQYKGSTGLTSIPGAVLEEAGGFLSSIFGDEESNAPQTVQGNTVSFKNNVLEQACTTESLVCVIPPQNIGKQEAPGIGNCRPGMLQVGNVCVDQYEAILVKNNGEVWSPYCNPREEINNLGAVSVAGVVPQSTISQLQAKQACENAGKRLCSNEEWVSVCQGTEKRSYPYSNDHQTGACNDEFPSRGMHVVKETVEVDYCPGYQPFYAKQGLDATGKKITFNTAPWMQHPKNNQQENSLDLTGSNIQCKTPEEVYDLVGNLAEWTADPEGTFRGGYYQLTQSNVGSGCLYRTTAHGPSYSDYSLGFRCCSNPIS